MPRYFFRLTDGVDLKDPQGDVLEDDDVARRAALEILTKPSTAGARLFWREILMSSRRRKATANSYTGSRSRA